MIKNGTVVDGSGPAALPGRRRRARTARIAAIGRIRERAREVIDADGQVVAPGFVDGHTHMDAQVFWDPLGTSLLLARHHQRGHGQLRLHAGALRRGGQAPGRAQPRARRGHLRRGDGRGHRVDAGRPSPSSSTPSTRLPKGINYAGYVGHSALRTYAMGERAFEQAGRPRTISRAMERELRDALRAGAIGFTTSRSPSHETPDRRPVASRLAELGRGAAAGRRDGRDERRHLRARRRGRGPRRRRSGPARLPRAAARPRRRDRAARSRSACSAAATRPTSGATYLALLDETAARGRPHVRPGAQPRAERACCRSRPSCRSTGCRCGRSCARCRSTSRSAQLRDPELRRAAGRGRARARRRHARVGTEARPADYDWIFVFDTVRGPAPLGGRDRARARRATRSRP